MMRITPRTLAAGVLGRILGCPCCGPAWYARFMARTYQLSGLPVPPELAGWVKIPD